ncbi:hypothetical protein GN956_G2964 [Arapaima gigas]
MNRLLSLLCLVALSSAQKTKRQPVVEWNSRAEAQKMDSKRCANLTLVLDNWKFAIMNQVKDLLLHDPSKVLPDYARIKPLSEALGDLYKELKGLKEHLGRLTNKFDQVEAFVDDIQAGKVTGYGRVLRPPFLRGRDIPFISTSPGSPDRHHGRVQVKRPKRA